MQCSKGFRETTAAMQYPCGFQGNIQTILFLKLDFFYFAHLINNLHHTAECNKTVAPFIK